MNNVSNNPGKEDQEFKTNVEALNIEVPRPTHEEIATMAYYIWLSEGCPEGCAERHWFEAEAQLIRTRQAEAMEKLKKRSKSAVESEQTIATARSSGAELAGVQQISESGVKKKKTKKTATTARARSNKITRSESEQSL
ncbi:MAG: DUF2934 domain-containing protein [Verrucomicrobiia bacterium]